MMIQDELAQSTIRWELNENHWLYRLRGLGNELSNCRSVPTGTLWKSVAE